MRQIHMLYIADGTSVLKLFIMKEGPMLEEIMHLNLLLYFMAVAGAVGAIGMFATHLTYRRKIRKTKDVISLREKWLSLWKTRDRLMQRMNLLVWLPSLFSTGLLGLSLFLNSYLRIKEGLPLIYLYLGTIVPVSLLLLRQMLDFTYREELIMNSLADYVAQMRTWVEEIPVQKKMDPVLQEEVVEKITSSIRQTAAAGSHFSKMLSPEEEEIMREIIREFMN